jgi:hypothetical protein
MRRYLCSILLLAGALAACGDNPTSSGPKVAAVALSQKAVSLVVGQEVALSASVRGPNQENVPDVAVQWESLNAAVATVTQAGVVRGVALGTAQIVARAGGRADTATVTVTGEITRAFNVNSNEGCANPVFKNARQVASSQRALIFEDFTNPPGGFTAAEYQEIATSFDNLIWPVATQNFGEPSDSDGNGKVIILYTRAVNELTPPNSTSLFGGFYYGRDLYPKVANGRLGACPASNEAEMFYLLAPDPEGEVNNNKRSKETVRRSTQGTVAHEFQHLINSSRRLFVLMTNVNEEVWLNEGLSHIAEELVFHAAANTAPRMDLGENDIRASAQRVDAFNSFSGANFGRFRIFLEETAPQSPIQTDDDLATRGSAWNFLRYSADRKAGNDRDLWFRLVNSTTRGLANYEAVFGVDAVDWLRDWTVAVYADNATTGVDNRFMITSWNFRSIYPLITSPARYPLKVDTLLPAAARTVVVSAGSAAYFRFAVPAGGTGDVRTGMVNTTVSGACTPVSLAVGGVFQGTAASAQALCVGEGEYTLMPFYGSRVGNASTQLTVVATGVTVPVGPPSPSLSPSVPLFTRTGTGLNEELLQSAAGIEARLRARERRELAPLTPGGIRANASVAADPAAPEVRISLMRTK